MLPNPYVIIATGVIWLASVAGAFFTGEHYQSLTDDKAIAAQKIESGALLAKAAADNTVKVAAAAKRNEEIAADADKKQATIDDAYVAYADLVAQRVRQPTGRGQRCVTTGSTQAGDASNREKLDAPGIFISEQAGIALGSDAKSADEQVKVLLACKAALEPLTQ